MSNINETAMPSCTVQLWYNKQRVKKNGNVSLYIQLIINGEVDQIPIKNLEWPIQFCNWSKKCIEPRYPNDPEIISYNAIIERERAKYWRVVMEYLKKGTSFTLSDIYRGVNTYGTDVLFCEFMAAAIKDRQRTKVIRDKIKYSTGRTHQTTLNELKLFLNGKDIDIKLIDDRFLEKFADYLRLKINEGTVSTRILNIKSYLTYAKRQKISVDADYALFKVSVEEPDPTWLDQDELQRLLDLYFGNELEAVNKRNLRAFLFACFTGLRISDLKRWKKAWISDNEFAFVPQKVSVRIKNPKPVVIPLIPLAKGFINDLKTDTFDLPSTDQVYNRELKVLAQKAGISKRLTSHVGRHTFATWLAIDAVPLLVISKLLGHKNTQTTQRYIHIAETYKAQEMMKLQTRFARQKPKDLKIVHLQPPT